MTRKSLFLACEPLAGWRHVAITERRTMQGPAVLVDEAYPEVPVRPGGLDNLNTHRVALLYETFPAAEARRIAKRLEFHYRPKRQLAEPGRNRVQRTIPFLPEAAAHRRKTAVVREEGPRYRSETRPGSPSTGGSRPRMPEPNYIASIP